MTSFRKTVTSLPFFQFTANLEQPGSWIPNAQSVKLIFFINGNLLSYKNRTKKSLTQLSHYCFDKGTILAGKADFFKKMQYKRYKKVYLLKLHTIVYLCAILISSSTHLKTNTLKALPDQGQKTLNPLLNFLQFSPP